MTCGIYMIQNLVNGKIYIGQAVDIKERWGTHKCELRGNYHENTHLQRSWNKYGEDKFEFTIICECEENQLNTMEEYYIFELMSYDRRVGYNKTYGGEGGRRTEESKQKTSETMKGRKHSEKTRKKMGESHKGKTIPDETRRKISETEKGKTVSEETKQKISKSLKSKYVGENNHMYGKSGFKNPRSIPIVQLTLDGERVEVHDSAMEAERRGFNNRHINSCCRGKRKTHKGYKWMYKSDYEAMKKED